MSEQRQTYLSALFTASTMDRWAERWAIYWTAYLLALLIFAWTPPDSLNPDLGPWGCLDAKRWLLITGWASGGWQAYKAIRSSWEARMALHHMHEEQLKKGPAQITINDNDGLPKPAAEFSVNPPSRDDRELHHHEYEMMQPDKPFGQFFTKKPKAK